MDVAKVENGNFPSADVELENDRQSQNSNLPCEMIKLWGVISNGAFREVPWKIAR